MGFVFLGIFEIEFLYKEINILFFNEKYNFCLWFKVKGLVFILKDVVFEFM